MARRPKQAAGARLRAGLNTLPAQAVVITGAALLYFLTRRLTEGSSERAAENGYAIWGFEARLDIAFEQTMHSTVLAHDAAVTACNWIYMWGHWPVIIAALLFLHLRHREGFRRLRNSMLASGAIGLVVFAWYPVTPPRLLPNDEFLDTVTVWSDSYRVLQPPSLVNQHAAMPSLHVGWNLLVGIVLWQVARHWVLRTLAVAGPVLMSVAVIATANHYVLDVFAGSAVALVGYGMAGALERCRGRPTARRRRAIAELGDRYLPPPSPRDPSPSNSVSSSAALGASCAADPMVRSTESKAASMPAKPHSA